MLPSTTCDGDVYLHNLSTFIKSHERQLANALLAYKKQPRSLQQQQQQQLQQQLNSKPVRLSLTLHHLYYLLERFQDMGISVGPMNLRLDNIHNDDSSLNYVSFLSDYHQNKRMSSDLQSIHSMSSVKSVMSSVSSLWTAMGSSSSYNLNSRDVLSNDIKYLYSLFTKLPCLRLAPDSRAKLIEGHEEFPFDTLVPLKCFKNLSVLEIYDLSLKEIYGWHIISQQIKFLVLKKANITDPVDVLIDLVEEDMNLRGTQQLYDEDVTSLTAIPSSKLHSNSSSSSSISASSPTAASSNTFSSTLTTMPSEFQPSSFLQQQQPQPQQQYHHLHHHKKSYSKHYHYQLSSSYNPSFHQLSGSVPDGHTPHLRTSPTLNHASLSRQYPNDDIMRPRKNTSGSVSNSMIPILVQQQQVSAQQQQQQLANTSKRNTLYIQSSSPPTSSRRIRRSKSNASDYSLRSRCSSPTPPPYPQQQEQTSLNKWRQLKHLSFTENNIVTISDWSFEPLKLLTSLDLSRNKLTEIPSALSHLKNLKSLNLSYNKLESTSGFKRNELTKLTILNLKSNKLKDLSSLEYLKNLEKLDLRSNKLTIKDLKPLLMGTKPLKLQLLFLQNNEMKNYRIELFNLFNGIDYGNTLKIDGSRPGIFESRLLLDFKNAELKLNKFFITQITNSISTMSLSLPQSPLLAQHKQLTSSSASTADSLGTIRPVELPPSPGHGHNLAQLSREYNQNKDYVLMPPFKPFVKPVLKPQSSQDTLTAPSSGPPDSSLVHSPSLIIRNHSDQDSARKSSAGKPASNKSAPTSPHNTLFPGSVTSTATACSVNGNSDSPRTLSSSISLASKLNRLSNDLTSIVATSNNSHDLLSQKLGSPLPPVITAATTTVNNNGNSNSSSQRTSIISTQINSSLLGKENSRIYDDNDNTITNNTSTISSATGNGNNISNTVDPLIKANQNINPAILYLINND